MCDSCVRAITVEAATGLPLRAQRRMYGSPRDPSSRRHAARRARPRAVADRSRRDRPRRAGAPREGRIHDRQAERAGPGGRRAPGRRGGGVRLPRRDQAQQRPQRAFRRGRGSPGAGRRRFDRGIHGLPATAGRANGDRGRRRLRAARLEPASGLSRSRHGAAQCQVPGRFVPALSARADHGGRRLHLSGDADAFDRRHRGRRVRPARASSSRSSSSARRRSGRGASSAMPATAATRSAVWSRPRSRRGWSSAGWPRPGCRGRRGTARPSSGPRGAGSRSTSTPP